MYTFLMSVGNLFLFQPMHVTADMGSSTRWPHVSQPFRATLSFIVKYSSSSPHPMCCEKCGGSFPPFASPTAPRFYKGLFSVFRLPFSDFPHTMPSFIHSPKAQGARDFY